MSELYTTNLGEAIAKIRNRLGINQCQMALMMNTPPSYLSAIENGNKSLTKAMLKRYCALDCINESDTQNIWKAYARDVGFLQVDISGLPDEKKEFLILFIEILPKLTNQKHEEIRKILYQEHYEDRPQSHRQKE